MELVLKEMTEQISGAAIDVHRELGPGLLESAYEECLCYELSVRKLRFVRQHSMALHYPRLVSSPVGRMINFNVARLKKGIICRVGTKAHSFSSLSDLSASVVSKLEQRTSMTI